MIIFLNDKMCVYKKRSLLTLHNNVGHFGKIDVNVYQPKRSIKSVMIKPA